MRHILYHAGCLDGFASAWAAWKRYGSSAIYTPVFHGRPIPQGEFYDTSRIYIVDFSYSYKVIRDLVKRVESVVILDHHTSSEDDVLKSFRYFQKVTGVHDSDHSGAYLAWKYFNPNQPVPDLIKYVEDRDLWRFQLDYTKEVCESLYSYPMEFELWNRLRIDDLIADGKPLLRAKQQQINRICKRAVKLNLIGHSSSIRCVSSTEHISEIGHSLLELHKDDPYVAVYQHNSENNDFKISLRSRGDVDVSKIAQEFGGGGHVAAAGYKTKKLVR